MEVGSHLPPPGPASRLTRSSIGRGNVGCGTGGHLRLLRELGWEVYGVEVDARACAEAKRVLRKEGGRPLIEVPNVESLSAHLSSGKGGLRPSRDQPSPTTSGLTGSLQNIWNEATSNPRGKRLRWSRGLSLSLWPISFLWAKLGRGELLRAVAFKRSQR